MPRSQVQPFSSTTSHSHWAAQRLSSNTLSKYYVLEKIVIPIVLYTNRGDGDFHLHSVKTQRFMAKPLHNSEKILIFAAELEDNFIINHNIKEE